MPENQKIYLEHHALHRGYTNCVHYTDDGTTQDDVIIVADLYDTTDHNQDGYGVYGAERFLYNFTFYNFFEDNELNDMRFLGAKPE